MQIGMVGLGLLGRAMAQRFLAAHHEIVGYDLDEPACHAATDLGVAIAPDARAIATQSDTIVLSLMTSEDRRRLFWGPQDMASALRPHAVVLDTTTARPQDIHADSARLAEERNARLVDVCVSGSSQVVLEGRAIVLIGDREEPGAYRDLLTAFAKKQYYFGAPGRGNEAKLIVNLVFGLNRLALSEALGLAARAEFDLATILDVLREGETYSTVMDTKGPKMLAGEYTPVVARLAQHAKDVHLILEYAQKIGAHVPVSEVHAELIDSLVAAGFGDLDNAAIFKAFE